MAKSEAGKGSDPRPVNDRKAYEQNMRNIFGCTVKIPGGEERKELMLEIANAYMEECRKNGLVVSMTIAIMTIGHTFYYLEEHC